jgi:hypothetical protein
MYFSAERELRRSSPLRTLNSAGAVLSGLWTPQEHSPLRTLNSAGAVLSGLWTQQEQSSPDSELSRSSPLRTLNSAGAQSSPDSKLRWSWLTLYTPWKWRSGEPAPPEFYSIAQEHFSLWKILLLREIQG